MYEADVIVVGAGPAGASAALNLAPTRVVLLLDRIGAAPREIGEALPSAAGRLFFDMGLLSAFRDQGHLPCHANRAVWGQPHAHETDSLRDPWGHGWHLDRRGFDLWLRQVASSRGAIGVGITNVTGIRRRKARWHLRAMAGDQLLELSARVLIDAAGRTAPIARRLGARRQPNDRLVCAWIAGRAERLGGGAGVSLVEAESEGWWYTAPTPGDRRVLAFHTDSDLLDFRPGEGAARLLDRAQHCAEIQGVLEASRFRAASRVAVTGANSGVLEPCSGPDWLAIGDAAISFDPLSSQGIFNALYTGLAAAETSDRLLRGEKHATADYRRALKDIHGHYRAALSSYYAIERRFGDARFWVRRHRPTSEELTDPNFIVWSPGADLPGELPRCARSS